MYIIIYVISFATNIYIFYKQYTLYQKNISFLKDKIINNASSG